MVLLRKELGVTENSYYEATVVRAPPSPPLAERVTADVCVVGGGFCGVSAALELALRGYSVALLEAQRIGWGASGRNGGQVIVGFGTDGEESIERQFAPEDARRAWDVSVEGLELLQSRIARFGIDCEYAPGYMSVVVKPRRATALQRRVDQVARLYGYPLQWIDRNGIRDWISSDRFHCGAYDPRSGHLHPLKYCLGLGDAARASGVMIYENSPVYLVERGEHPVVRTAQGEVHCRFVVLAGNVYLGEYGDEIAPEIAARIMPVGTYVIATEPMDQDRASALMPNRPAVSDTNFILDYFRLSADNRLVFGAGETYSATTPRNLIGRMRKQMLRVFPQLADLDIPHSWGGFVDITWNEAPDFGRIGSNIFYLQGFSGHGVALSGMAGKMVAEAIAGQAERFDLFARIRHMKFPGGAKFRTPALVLGMTWYRLRDLV